jgi:tetratricopeptide (TPR) repeat protein
MGEYSKALSLCEKAIEIREKTLLGDHPDLATSYNNVALVYESMKEYSKALSYFERALIIWESSLPFMHPQLQSVRVHIKYVKQKL